MILIALTTLELEILNLAAATLKESVWSAVIRLGWMVLHLAATCLFEFA